MGILRRKKSGGRRVTTLVAPVRVEAAMNLELLDTERERDFDLYEHMSAMFVLDCFASTHVFNAAGIGVDQWWSNANLREQYEAGGRDEREEALRGAMRFNNVLDGAEYDDAEPLLLHATVRLKALALALACDVEYGTTHLQTIAVDPLSYGVHEFG